MKIIDGKPYINQIRDLIIEYRKMLGRDLCFQNIEEELENPLKKYSEPDGKIYVAIDDEKVVGMIAYQKLSDKICEMKRLYVNPEYRGFKLGEQLIKELLASAKYAGYREMVLDTITPLEAAISLYKRVGFKECAPYYDNPMNDVIYMSKEL